MAARQVIGPRQRQQNFAVKGTVYEKSDFDSRIRGFFREQFLLRQLSIQSGGWWYANFIKVSSYSFPKSQFKHIFLTKQNFQTNKVVFVRLISTLCIHFVLQKINLSLIYKQKLNMGHYYYIYFYWSTQTSRDYHCFPIILHVLDETDCFPEDTVYDDTDCIPEDTVYDVLTVYQWILYKMILIVTSGYCIR